jgi:hypothetical protein
MSEYNHVVDKEDHLAVNKVDSALDRINPDKKEQILQSFDSFKSYLGKRIELAEKLGLSEEQIAVTAEKIANYLAANEEPRNSEEKLLNELWKVGTPEEQHKLAHMLVRLAQRAG